MIIFLPRNTCVSEKQALDAKLIEIEAFNQKRKTYK